MIKAVFILIAMELLLPVLFGAVFALSDENVTGRKHFFFSSLVNGQIVLYAIFQITTVWSILNSINFSYAVKRFVPVAVAVLTALIVIAIVKYRKRFAVVFKGRPEKISFWGIIGFLLFVFMMVMSFFMTYTDGDDAYYVTTAAEAVFSDTMYAKNPYSGTGTISSFRYKAAPYPLWLALLSGASGIHPTALAHTFFPWTMILLSFSVFFLMARNLFGGDTKKRGMFLFFASVLIMFGDYSIYPAENFLLARARQGKAALAAFVLPYLVCLMIRIAKQLRDKDKCGFRELALITFTGFAASLCSTIGGALSLALVSVSALVMAVTYKKLKTPALMVLMVLPSVAFVLLYLVKG
ncbi:MAG: hypothetical protein J6W85_04885 [Lachnospiraceae bacterium]|nr:hypothetical protein [Lachnospiraceae bacterium]